VIETSPDVDLGVLGRGFLNELSEWTITDE
jgi:hypothetical protein